MFFSLLLFIDDSDDEAALSMLMLLLFLSLSCEQEVRELLDPDRGGIGGSARSGEAEERLETLAQRREELSKVTLFSLLWERPLKCGML